MTASESLVSRLINSLEVFAHVPLKHGHFFSHWFILILNEF